MAGTGGEMSQTGWFEEYRCGCVSPMVTAKRDLPGYCPRHGDNRRELFREWRLRRGRGVGLAIKAGPAPAAAPVGKEGKSNV